MTKKECLAQKNAKIKKERLDFANFKKILKAIPDDWDIDKLHEYGNHDAEARLHLNGSWDDVKEYLKQAPPALMVRHKAACTSFVTLTYLHKKHFENDEICYIAPFLVCGEGYTKRMYVSWFSTLGGVLTQVELNVKDGPLRYGSEAITKYSHEAQRQIVVGKSWYLLPIFNGAQFSKFSKSGTDPNDIVVWWPEPNMTWDDVQYEEKKARKGKK